MSASWRGLEGGNADAQWLGWFHIGGHSVRSEGQSQARWATPEPHQDLVDDHQVGSGSDVGADVEQSRVVGLQADAVRTWILPFVDTVADALAEAVSGSGRRPGAGHGVSDHRHFGVSA